MSSDIMCNGHRFVKSTLFQSPSYLADLSPYISAVISSRLIATPIQLTANAIKPIAQSLLPTRASNFILNGTLTCEYCLHQVQQTSFDDGRVCPSLLLEKLIDITDSEFILADQLLEAQDKNRISKYNNNYQNHHHQYNNKHQSSSSSSSTPSSSSHNTTTIDNLRTNNHSNETTTSNTLKVNSTESNLSDTTTITSTTRLNSSDDINLEQQNYNKGSRNNRNENNRKERAFKQSEDAHIYKNDLLIIQICPEIGLHAQGFACIDCDKLIDLNTSRLCHFDGRYYCYACHTGSDLIPIPARVLRNWDFTPKPVSKTSMQKICFLRTKPVLFNIFQFNSMLYGFIDRLVDIKQIRERIQSMLKYLEVCGQPNKPYLIPVPKHFLNAELLNFFTLNDLFDIDQVYNSLSQLQSALEKHIVVKCESCRGKGYYCELCKEARDILYPFSKNGTTCNKCHTVYHKNCFQRKKKNCPKCVRINVKRSRSRSSSAVNDSNYVDDNDFGDESFKVGSVR